MAPQLGEPHLFIVIGGSGHLMQTKLLPALYHLAAEGQLPPMALLGAGRRALFTDATYAQWARTALTAAGLPVDEPGAAWCDDCLHYQALGEETPEDYQALAARVREIEAEHNLPGNRVFYLALPPTAIGPTAHALGQAGLCRSAGWTRLVIEKPFGNDLASARRLDEDLKLHFSESQTYRIDHYLGKETVQNILVFRFANTVFEALWRRECIANVQITVGETAGIEERAAFYDQVGVLRDMMQNHLAQLLALVAMEAPPAFDPDAVRDEKAAVLRAIPALEPVQVVLGQYAAGQAGGKAVPGYLEAPGVPPDSHTPTFAAIEVRIDTPRWQGVPFYLRSGKRLAEGLRQIVVNFRCPCSPLFTRFPEAQANANALILTLEPDEGFALQFGVKAPGDMLTIQPEQLHFRYDEVFGRLPEAYEALLLDVLQGDQTLFVRIDEVLEAWRVYAPALAADLPVYPYEAGTWGPKEADRLIVPVGGVCWLDP